MSARSAGRAGTSSWDGSINRPAEVTVAPARLLRLLPATMTPWTTTERSYDANRVRLVRHGCHRPVRRTLLPPTKNRAVVAAGVDVAIVSGTHIGNVDGQLNARPAGRTALAVLNSGSEVFQVGPHGPVLRGGAKRVEPRIELSTKRPDRQSTSSGNAASGRRSLRQGSTAEDRPDPLCPSGLVLHRSISTSCWRRRRAAQGLWPLLARRSRQPGSYAARHTGSLTLES